jgi:hypothetical protein
VIATFLLLIDFSFIAMMPSVNQQRFTTRSADEINVKRFSYIPNVKPPREVSLRVKFIRLGEVS